MDSWRLLLLTVGLLGAASLSYAADEKAKDCKKEDCPWALYNHYEAKGCKPVHENGSCCPTSFECTDYVKTKPEEGCQFKGRTYKQAETINTTNPCHSCKCGAKGVSGCAVIECFSEISQPNCIPLFDHTDCCPKNYYCLSGEKKSLDEVDDTITCKWEGRTYVKGQIIEIKDEPCTTCICDSDFNGPKSPPCKTVECSFPGNNLKMKRGCCPVYLKSRCCSVDWICPPEGPPALNVLTARSNEKVCFFGNRTIPLGKSLDLQDPCTICNCTTPPDLTCIREQCKGPPDNNFARCRPIPKEGQCCPEFQCAPPGAMPFDGPGPFPGGPPRPEIPPEGPPSA